LCLFSGSAPPINKFQKSGAERLLYYLLAIC
jgi:hypothetical protein